MTHTLLAALATAALAFAATPAHADSTREVDVRGDAPAPLDITKVDFRYDARGAHARIHVADLQPAGEFVLAVTNRTQSLRYGLAATGHPDGSRTSTFYRLRDGVLSGKRCGGAAVRWSPARDVVTLSFPERCFRPLRRTVVFAVGSTREFPDGVTVDEGPVSVLRAPRP